VALNSLTGLGDYRISCCQSAVNTRIPVEPSDSLVQRKTSGLCARLCPAATSVSWNWGLW